MATKPSPDQSQGPPAPPAAPTRVNPVITDSVADVGVTVLGQAPAVAMGQMYQSLAQSTGLMFQNAVSAQQNMNTASQAATITGVMQLYGIDPNAGAARAPAPRSGGGDTAALAALIGELLVEMRKSNEKND